jgi:pseudaminic acid cytidylyltransferase
MKNLAIIPARGGSKRIPRKNIKPFMGKPIMAYSIEAALKSNIFDEVMVSTDDEEIASIAKEFGAIVPFMRSEKTANDYATTADVICEVIECYHNIGKDFDTVCCIYSTAPFVTSDRIIEAYSLLQNFDSVFTAVSYSSPIQRGLKIEDGKIKMIWPQYRNTRSQDLEPVYHDAGQFYVAKVAQFLKEKTFWTEKAGGIILPELEVQDLDTETDWQLAEMKYKLLHS